MVMPGDVLARDRRGLEGQLVAVEAGEQVGRRTAEHEVRGGGQLAGTEAARRADLGVEVGQRAPGREELVAGTRRQLGLQRLEPIHAGRGELAGRLDVGVRAAGAVGRQQAAYALAGLLGEGVEGVGDELLGAVAGRELLELGEPGAGLGEERTTACGVVAREPDLRGLDAALDAVEGLARQGRLRGDGHRGGRADEGRPAQQGGDATVAGPRGGRHGQALGRGGLAEQHRVGLGHQALAQRADELGARRDLGDGPEVGDHGDEGRELRCLPVGEGGAGAPGEERLELVGTSSYREGGCHRALPVSQLVVPPTQTNERDGARVTAVTISGEVISPSTPPAGASRGCVRRGAGAASRRRRSG